MNAGSQPVSADFWLLKAPDNLAHQSRRNPDGTGIGWFDAQGRPHLDKRPKAAYDDPDFVHDARGIRSATIVSHIRAATTGQDRLENCHPFLIDGRLMAHNGGFGNLSAVDAELGSYAEHLGGDTDSERFAALIALRAAELGDVGAGIAAAANWIAQNVPMYSLNTIVIADGQLWALRYPDQRALHIGIRALHGQDGAPARWEGESHLSRVAMSAENEVPAVVVASERIDTSRDWRMLDVGELVHVDRDLVVTSTTAVSGPPRYLHLPDEPDPNDDAY